MRPVSLRARGASLWGGCARKADRFSYRRARRRRLRQIGLPVAIQGGGFSAETAENGKKKGKTRKARSTSALVVFS